MGEFQKNCKNTYGLVLFLIISLQNRSTPCIIDCLMLNEHDYCRIKSLASWSLEVKKRENGKCFHDTTILVPQYKLPKTGFSL